MNKNIKTSKIKITNNKNIKNNNRGVVNTSLVTSSRKILTTKNTKVATKKIAIKNTKYYLVNDKEKTTGWILKTSTNDPIKFYKKITTKKEAYLEISKLKTPFIVMEQDRHGKLIAKHSRKTPKDKVTVTSFIKSNKTKQLKVEEVKNIKSSITKESKEELAKKDRFKEKLKEELQLKESIEEVKIKESIDEAKKKESMSKESKDSFEKEQNTKNIPWWVGFIIAFAIVLVIVGASFLLGYFV